MNSVINRFVGYNPTLHSGEHRQNPDEDSSFKEIKHGDINQESGVSLIIIFDLMHKGHW